MIVMRNLFHTMLKVGVRTINLRTEHSMFPRFGSTHLSPNVELLIPQFDRYIFSLYPI